ncbi:MAG: ATP synthase F1 subunit epsilon [Patescibacteria group bacterium]|nr:ATP synthase F1 subunit epsilon [Patescibacteria group bacterium]
MPEKNSSRIQFKIITPEKEVFSQEITQVTMSTMDGEITVLPFHESLIGGIEPGEICIKTSDGELYLLAVSYGFFEIENNSVKVFADTADRAEELNEQTILKAKQEAEQALKEKINSDLISVEAEIRLKKELAKLRVLEKYKKTKKR